MPETATTSTQSPTTATPTVANPVTPTPPTKLPTLEKAPNVNQIKQALLEKKRALAAAASQKDSEVVKKIVKRVNRDKEANTAGRVPSKSLLKKKKRKQSETSKPSSVVKPHASLPLPLHTPKKAKVPIPTAPQKAERAVTPPGEERIFTPKVSENNSDSVTHSQQPRVSDPLLQELDSFVSHEPKSLRSLIVDEEEEFELGFDWTVEEQLDTMAPTKQQQSQDYAKLKKKYESQKIKLEKLKGELEDCHESMDNQGREIQRANEQVLELQKTVEASSAPEDTKNRLVSLSTEVGTLKANLAIHAKNNKAFQKNEDKLLKEVQGLKERQTTLSGLKEKLEKELGDAQAELQDLRSSSSGPQSQESAKKIAELEKKVKDLSAQKVTGPQKVIASLRNVANKLDEENKKLKEDLKNRSEVDGNGTMIGSLTKEVDSLKRQLRTVNRDKQRLEEELAEATTSRPTSTLNEDLDTSDVSAQALLAENKTLKTDKKKLEAALARCLQALKDGGKFMEEEVSGPVKKKVTNWIKEVGFHTTKFLSGEVHVNEFVKEVYDALCEHDADAAAWTDSSSPRYLPFPEFVRIYKKVIRTAVNNRRQYTQTQCLKAAIEFSKKFGRLIQWQDLENIFQMIPKEDDTAEVQAEKQAILGWYFDSWLPACAGIEHYGPRVRYYHRATKGCPVLGGAKVAYVPIAAEALGLVIFENCEEKWKHIVPKKVKDPNWKVPTYNKSDKTTHKYHVTKWSDGSSGQVTCGGWKDEGVTKFGEHMKAIETFRAKDKKNKHKFYQFGLNLLRELHGVNNKKAPGLSGRKCKRPTLEKQAPKIPTVNETFSEDEDDFSMHSEVSSGEQDEATGDE